jgi:ribonuclease Z
LLCCTYLFLAQTASSRQRSPMPAMEAEPDCRGTWPAQPFLAPNPPSRKSLLDWLAGKASSGSRAVSASVLAVLGLMSLLRASRVARRLVASRSRPPEPPESTMHKMLLRLIVPPFLVLGLMGPIQGQTVSDFKVTLLGTGTPQPRADRFGPSTLVEAGDQKLLFDAGRGVPIRLGQLNIPIGKITALFITHYHSDHTAGIPDIWLTGWLPPPYAKRTTPFHVVGPPGAKALMANLEKAYALDIKIRLEDQKLPVEGIATLVEEFNKDGVVYENNGVKVIAFEVDHGAAIKPAVGYRVEYKGHSVLISGDTRYNENVVKFGAGVDLLIHEVAIARPELMSNPAVKVILAHHTMPREAGMVFARAKPKLAVYTHIDLQSTPQVPEASLDDLVAETRQTYGGPLEIGEDLMSFEIGDQVTVRRFKP